MKTALKIKSNVRAGAYPLNRNATRIPIKSKVRSGVGPNHNATRVR
jgi:hypothetical protein